LHADVRIDDDRGEQMRMFAMEETMSAEVKGKADWLDQIDQAERTWEAIVAGVGDAGIERPGAAGDWTFKDVAGHLNGWRTRTVNRLEAAARNEPPLPAPWPADLTDETDEGVDAINQWIYEQNRDRPATEILAEAREQFQRMRAAVAAIPEDDLVTPGCFPWLGDYPLSAVVEGSGEHLYEEHEPALRAWMAGLSS
jgi:hypothetical protein